MAHVFTVREAMIACGVDDITLFNGATQAQRLATEMFSDDFRSCMDKTMDEVDEDLKTFAGLTVAQGQIRLTVGTKTKVKGLLQWSRDMIRTGRDPTTEAYPAADIIDIMRRYKSHEAYIQKAKTITENAKPVRMKPAIKWEDWKPVFLNFLRSIPGRDGHPLSYVCRDNDNPVFDPNLDLLDMYIAAAPLHGEAYNIDKAEVHTYITSLIAGNETAEAKILPHQAEQDGRLDFKALVEHYEGVGIHAIDITKAHNIINNVFYNGERKPYMWWEEFEKQLTMAFVIHDRREGRQVYSDEMKLRILCNKVNADFLQHIRSSIDIELNRNPVTMTYNQALANFRNEVNRCHPPELSSKGGRNARRISQVHQGRGGRGGRNGRGRGRGGGRIGNRNRGTKRNRQDARFITDINGRRMEVHPSYVFSPDEWARIPQDEQQRLRQERADYRNSNNRRGSGSNVSQVHVQTPGGGDNATIISEITTDARTVGQAQSAGIGNAAPSSGTIMGGRNERAELRSRNQHQ